MNNDMKLPEGLTCAECDNHAYCHRLFGCQATNTECDWSPSIFVVNAALFRSLRKRVAELEGKE